MIRSMLSAVGLVVVMVVLINFSWLTVHHEPVTLRNITDTTNIVTRSTELLLRTEKVLRQFKEALK